jgi:hypothetical protein
MPLDEPGMRRRLRAVRWVFYAISSLFLIAVLIEVSHWRRPPDEPALRHLQREIAQRLSGGTEKTLDLAAYGPAGTTQICLFGQYTNVGSELETQFPGMRLSIPLGLSTRETEYVLVFVGAERASAVFLDGSSLERVQRGRTCLPIAGAHLGITPAAANAGSASLHFGIVPR